VQSAVIDALSGFGVRPPRHAVDAGAGSGVPSLLMPSPDRTRHDGRLEGKVALITGTGGGQGPRRALRFAPEGAAVVGCDLNPRAPRRPWRWCAPRVDAWCRKAPVDLTDEDAVRAWLDFAVAEFGTFDILYNNAAAIRSGTHRRDEPRRLRLDARQRDHARVPRG